MQTGQTPLAIAQKLGYVSVVETLKTVTETTVITETTTVTEERYKPQNPEAMNETMFSDSEDEGMSFHLFRAQLASILLAPTLSFMVVFSDTLSCVVVLCIFSFDCPV